MSRRRRWLTHNRPLVILGAVVLAIILVAGIVPQFIIAGLRQLPKDETYSYLTEAADARVVDLSAFQAGDVPSANAGLPECAGDEPAFSCFVVDGQAELARSTESASTETREEVAVTSSSVFSVDGEPFMNIEDFVRLQSHSAFPVPDPNSRMSVALPGVDAEAATGEFSRSGLQYFFPFNTERISYDFFDPMSQLSTPVDFVDRVEHEGMRTYEFQQTLPAVNLMASLAQGYTQPQGISDAPELEPLARTGQLDDEQREAIASLRVNGAASQFYSEDELADGDLGAEDRVSLSPFYSVDRTLWVEPRSGTVVDRVEDIVVYLAADQSEADEMAAGALESSGGGSGVVEDAASGAAASDVAGAAASEREVLSTRLAWDAPTREQAQARAQSTVNVLKTLEVVSLAGNTIVVLLVSGGLFWVLRRHFRKRRAEGVAVSGPGLDGTAGSSEDEAGADRVAGDERKSAED